MLPINKKIALLHPYVSTTGGAVKMMLYLGDILSEKNNVTFFTFRFDSLKYCNDNRNFGIRDFYKNRFFKLLNVFLIAFSIRKSDYIIVGNSPMHFVGVLSKILFFSKAKLVWWNHHYPWYYDGNTSLGIFFKRSLEKMIVKKIDLIVVNSNYLQRAIKKIYNRDSQILYPVLDKGFENYKIEQKQNKFTLFTYGRWEKGKNIGLIFKLFEQLKNNYPELKIIIGGEGQQLDFYKNKYKRNKQIEFSGLLNRSSIISNFKKTNIFLFPSLIDSFGLTIVESLSQAVPVICFDKSGQGEIIDNQINGFLVNTDSEFIEKTKLLLIDDDLRDELSKACLNKTILFKEKSFLQQLSKILTV